MWQLNSSNCLLERVELAAIYMVFLSGSCWESGAQVSVLSMMAELGVDFFLKLIYSETNELNLN